MKWLFITLLNFLILTTLGPNPVFAANAMDCTDAQGSKGVNTAIGCISTDVNSGGFIRTVLGTAIGIGGGIALTLILYGVYIITSSAGIPDKLKQGQEIITSAIIGLVFIILSIVLMNLIGVQILGIPGL